MNDKREREAGRSMGVVSIPGLKEFRYRRGTRSTSQTGITFRASTTTSGSQVQALRAAPVIGDRAPSLGMLSSGPFLAQPKSHR